MARALRCISLALLGLALVPGVAAANVEVDFNATTGILTVTESVATPGSADAVTVRQQGNAFFVSSASGIANTGGGCTPAGANEFTCTGAAVIAADLGAGNDSFSSTDVNVPESIAGGAGNDTLNGGNAGDVLSGGDGNDTLNGGAGVDDYFGEGNDDQITSRDNNAERIACGAGTDTVENDFTDIIAECERGRDVDNDGFATTVDCNDANAAIRPGAPEIFGNGVDENCNGRDDVNLDKDGDGFAVPVDCDDANAAIRPNAAEIRGNVFDENCDRRADPWSVAAAAVTNRWSVSGSTTRLRSLVVRLAPKGATVRLRCRGRTCPFTKTRTRAVPRDLAPVSFSSAFRRARLRSGVRLTLSVTAPESVGRTYTYTVKRGALPDSRIVCRAPGESQGQPC